MGANENLTILFTDIVNYTRITGAQTRSESKALLRRHDELLLPIVKAYAGRRVKSIGDAMLLTFRSPTDAIHCGMALQDALADARQAEPEHYEQLHIRVAVNLGEVRSEKKDVYGEPVNIAARLEGLTPADEVYFTEAVYLAMNKAEVPSEAVGTEQLKGIPEPIRIYRVPAFQFSRLVPTGASANSEHQLPFGGAHLRRPAERRGVLPQARAQVAEIARPLGERLPLRQLLIVGACLVLGWALWWLLQGTAPDSQSTEVADSTLRALAEDTNGDAKPPAERIDQEFISLGESELDAGNLQGLDERITQRLNESPDNPEAILLRGHLAYAQDKLSTAAVDYELALFLRPGLALNQRLATNLAQSLGRISTLSQPLIRRHPSPAVIEALAQRSGQEGYHGRIQAIGLLEELGHADRIDHFGHNLEELRGRSRCEDRRKAIIALQELGNPAAVPDLHLAIGEGLGGWWKNRCLRAAARDAIATLEKMDKTNSPGP